MKVTLLAINAKYVHSSLSVWLVAGGVAKYAKNQHEVGVVEATINQDLNDIADLIVRENPDVLGISTYIWNAELLPELLKILRQKLPNLIIVLGGPEASHNPKYWLNFEVGYVICGEGELAFAMLLDCLAEGDLVGLNRVPGLYYNDYGAIQSNPLCKPSHEFVNPYCDEYFARLNGRLAYIETSRGCPFSCAYCLSGGDDVRFFPLNEVRRQMAKLAKSGARTIKFIDRTFNCNAERAREIFKYIIDFKTDVCFHFEVAADLFDDATIELLNNAPPGRIQFEIGVQSFNEKTLEAVVRKTNLAKVEENVSKLLALQNIHIHVDLIAGLPFEDLESFANGFNRAYELGAHVLQLGFLKLLHGSRLRVQAEEFGVEYCENPPYEVICTRWLSEENLQILKSVENALQHTYNRGRFLSAIEYVLTITKLTPFEFYYGLGEVVSAHALSLDIYAERFYEYCVGLPNVCQNELRDRIVCDFLQNNHGKNIPKNLKSYGSKRRKVAAIASEQVGRAINYAECEVLADGVGIYVDSSRRCPVSGLHKLHFTN